MQGSSFEGCTPRLQLMFARLKVFTPILTSYLLELSGNPFLGVLSREMSYDLPKSSSNQPLG